MKVISTNIAEPVTISWNGSEINTGIFKLPVNSSIFLDKETVEGDEVSDRKVHGGEFKACYLFSSDHYEYWQNIYPDLKWNYGMFGENLTVKGLDESKIQIGDIFKIGDALVQVTQPREPCFKLGIKFGTPDVIKQFIDHALPGIYVKVLQSGSVKKGDIIQLIESATNSISIVEMFQLIYQKEKNQKHLIRIINNEALPLRKRLKLKSFLNNH